MSDILESFLSMVCSSVRKTQQNAQQTLYVLGDAREAKMAYDLLIVSGIDTKYYAEEHGGKLYVQNASLSDGKLNDAVSAAPMFKQMKQMLDAQPALGDYTLSITDTPAGRQLTLVMPGVKSQVSGVKPSVAAPATQTATTSSAAPAATGSKALRTAAKQEEADLLAGPSVVRASIPKSMKTSATGEDSLLKRIFLYLSGRAFTSLAWALFIAMVLGFIFSFLVTIKGFLCPDVATDARTIPSYCPKPAPRPVQQ